MLFTFHPLTAMTTGQNVRCSSIYLLCTMVLLFLVCGPALQFWLLAPCYGVFSSIMKQCVSPTCTREQTAPAARGPFSRAVCQQLTAGFCCNSCYLNAMHPLVAESLHIMPHGGHCSGPASWLSGDDANGGNRSCLLYTSPSPRDQRGSRMPSSA